MRINVFSEKTATSVPIFGSLTILKLNEIIINQITAFVFECVHNLAPSYFHKYFTSIEIIHNIGTRRQSIRDDLFALGCNTTQYGLRSIHYSGVRLWNSLPLEIRNFNSLSSFRIKLKHFLATYKS